MPRRHGAKRRGLPQRGRRVLLDPAKDAGAAGQRGVIYRLTGAYNTLRTYTIDYRLTFWKTCSAPVLSDTLRTCSESYTKNREGTFCAERKRVLSV